MLIESHRPGYDRSGGGSRAPLHDYSRLYEPRPISPRERAVWALLAAGATQKEAARDLGISPHTAQNHIAALHDKLGVRTLGELIAVYYGAVPYSQRPGGPHDTESHA